MNNQPHRCCVCCQDFPSWKAILEHFETQGHQNRENQVDLSEYLNIWVIINEEGEVEP